MATGYGAGCLGSFRCRAIYFSLFHSVQTGYTVGTGDSSPGVKRGDIGLSKKATQYRCGRRNTDSAEEEEEAPGEETGGSVAGGNTKNDQEEQCSKIQHCKFS
jgi:hypothetical protein